MRKTIALCAAAAVTVGLFAAAAQADKKEAGKEKEKKFAATCPVSGKPAIKDSKVKFAGKDVFFCCQGCPGAFKKDPKKFANQVNVQFLETAQITQVGCPISGRPLNKDATIALGKTKAAFCCENCLGKAEAAPAKELAALVFKDFDKGFTLQTKCPVSGKPIVAAQVVKHNKKNVYFCCPGCPGAFKADPDKFLAKLPQFQTEKKKDM